MRHRLTSQTWYNILSRKDPTNCIQFSKDQGYRLLLWRENGPLKGEFQLEARWEECHMIKQPVHPYDQGMSLVIHLEKERQQSPVRQLSEERRGRPLESLYQGRSWSQECGDQRTLAGPCSLVCEGFQRHQGEGLMGVWTVKQFLCGSICLSPIYGLIWGRQQFLWEKRKADVIYFYFVK